MSTIRRMEGSELQPIVIDGKHCFPVEEVDRHRRLTDSELAAKAFRMFNEGSTVIEAVVELEEAPERIERLHEFWVKHTYSAVVLGFEDLPQRIDFVFRRLGNLTPTLIREALDIIDNDPKLRERLVRATREAS